MANGIVAAAPEKCAKEECVNPAEVALGLSIYPPKALMEHYKTTEPLTRMLLNLRVCRACAAGLTYKDLVTPDVFLPVCQLVEKSSGTAVDIDATKVVPVEYTDPDYLMMLEQSRKAPVSAGAELTVTHEQAASAPVG